VFTTAHARMFALAVSRSVNECGNYTTARRHTLSKRDAKNTHRLAMKLRGPSLSRFVTVHSRHRQTTYYDNSRTLQCKLLKINDPVCPLVRLRWVVLPVNIQRICKSTFRRPYSSIYHTFVRCHRFVLQVSVDKQCVSVWLWYVGVP